MATLWVTGLIECRICTHRWVSVQECGPETTPLQGLECPNCRNMTGDAVDNDCLI